MVQHTKKDKYDDDDDDDDESNVELFVYHFFTLMKMLRKSFLFFQV